MIKKLREFLASNLSRWMAYVAVVLFSLYFAYSSIRSFQGKVTDVGIRPTQLNILEILNTNELVVAQHGVDYFLNTGDYVAILPYTVKAGFKLGDHLESLITHEGDITVVRLPKPEILSVTASSDVKPTAVKDGMPDGGVTKAMRIFGEKYAKKVALKNNILVAAKERGIEVIRSSVKTLGLGENVRVEVAPADAEPQDITIENDFLPIQVTVPVEFPYEIRAAKKGATLCDNSFLLYKKNTQSSSPFGAVWANEKQTGSDYKNNIIPFFDPLHPKKFFGLLFEEKTKEIGFVFHAGDRLYGVSFSGTSKEERDEILPDFMVFLYGLEENNKTVLPCANLAGHTQGDFEGMLSVEKAEYFMSVNKGGLKKYKFNNIGVLTDDDGFNHITSNQKEWQDEIEQSFLDLKNSNNTAPKDYYAILYEYNTVHRNRIMFFSDNGVAFYVPGRFLQDKIAEFITYKEFFDLNKVNLKDNQYSINGKELASDELNNYLNLSVTDGIISLYNPKCTK